MFGVFLILQVKKAAVVPATLNSAILSRMSDAALATRQDYSILAEVIISRVMNAELISLLALI